jgi:tetratricopeptide (TPR) repeat protein
MQAPHAPVVLQAMNRYIFCYADIARARVRRSPAIAAAAALLVLAGAVLAGCGGGPGTASRAEPPAVDEASRERALQHFISGSVLETKGDYAGAVLDYQDAQRLDPNDAVSIALARCYSSLNRHTLAVEYGRAAVSVKPDNLDYRRTLAAVYLAAFEIDSAAAQYAEIVRRDSSDVDSWFNMARLYQGRRPEQALAVYERLLQRFGPQWEVLLQIAEINGALQRHDRAAEALRRMTELEPGNRELKRNLARTYVRGEAFDSAMAVLGDLRETDPTDAEAIADIAAIHVMRGDYGAARTEFDRLISAPDGAVEPKLRVGEACFAKMERDSTAAPLARRVFEKIRDDHPGDWRPSWFLGAIGALTRDDRLAEASFRRVTELASWNAEAWVYLSSVFLQEDRYAEAVPVLEAAVKAVPREPRVNFFLGVAYNRVGRNEEAARALERARELSPKDVPTISQLALVYETMGRQTLTDSLYEEALRLEPDNHLILNNYSYSLSERNIQIERALAMAKRAVEAQPQNPSYLDTIGWIYYRLGDYPKAEEYVLRAIQSGDVSAVVHDHLGDIYQAMGDAERALEQWKIALRLDPGNAAFRAKVESRQP